MNISIYGATLHANAAYAMPTLPVRRSLSWSVKTAEACYQTFPPSAAQSF